MCVCVIYTQVSQNHRAPPCPAAAGPAVPPPWFGAAAPSACPAAAARAPGGWSSARPLPQNLLGHASYNTVLWV